MKRAGAQLQHVRFDSLHRLLALGAAATVVTACSPHDPAPAAGAADASRIFVGGPIVTVDAAKPNAEAVAVRDRRMVPVGKRTEVLKLMGPTTEVVNPKGRTLRGACTHTDDDRQGSISEGQLADLVILSDSPVTVDLAQIDEIVLLEMITEGKTVYKR